MKKILMTLVAAVLLVPFAMCAERPDTVVTAPAARQIIAPAALVAVGSFGSASHWWRKHIDSELEHKMGSHRQWRIAEGAEWLPYAAFLGADYIGGKAAAGIADRALMTATSFVILEAITQPAKRIVGRRRPDGSDCHSFPSGHTATAFAGAELTRMAYGPVWGAGAYVVATGVAAMRMAGRHHFLSDCIAGAGIGILSARFASWLLPWERKILRLDRRTPEVTGTSHAATSMAIIPVASTDAVGCSLLLSF